MCFGVPSVVGGPAAVAKTLPICSWLRAHLLRSHLIHLLLRLKSLLLQDSRFRDLSPDAGLPWPGNGCS